MVFLKLVQTLREWEVTSLHINGDWDEAGIPAINRLLILQKGFRDLEDTISLQASIYFYSSEGKLSYLFLLLRLTLLPKGFILLPCLMNVTIVHW